MKKTFLHPSSFILHHFSRIPCLQGMAMERCDFSGKKTAWGGSGPGKKKTYGPGKTDEG
jgi:hypothetical protein